MSKRKEDKIRNHRRSRFVKTMKWLGIKTPTKAEEDAFNSGFNSGYRWIATAAAINDVLDAAIANDGEKRT